MYDFEVAQWHNYIAADLVHHNTDTAAYEIACHLTGDYPHWWHGRKFLTPNQWWAAGDTMQTTRDIVQVALLGPHDGVKTGTFTGMIPPYLIADFARRSGGISNCVDVVYVKHIPTGGQSSLAFKSYDQGRRVFQGTEQHGIWLDEEPPDGDTGDAQGSGDIYTECLLRTMTTNGLIISTFTPLRGMTPFLLNYLETATMPGTDGADVTAKAHFYPDILDKDVA